MDLSENLPHSSKTEGVKRNLKFSFHESTPVLKSKSRKRKTFVDSNSQFSESFDSSQSSFQSLSHTDTSYDTCISDSCESYDYRNSLSQNNKSCLYELSFDINHVMVSSPLNKNNETLGLSSSLEKCSLFDFETCSKRIKWDNESPNGKRKSNSAPGTPNHPGKDSESSFKKYHSIDFTPTKSQYDNNFGFNSPECKKILYPQLVERKPAIKPKSPQKLRAELKRLNKPAKKRLFLNHDFVYLFTRASNHRQIVHKIFSYLNDSDLMNVVKVSKLWKYAVYEDSDIHARYKKFNTYMIRSKENLRNDSMNLSINRSQAQFSVEKENYYTPETSVYSPVKTNFQKYARLAEKLTPNQQLAKCPSCGDPSVIERNIAQCTNHGCQYIWCNRCLSGSKRGPDHFLCKCEKGTTPPRSEKYQSLGDISNIDSPNKNFSFLENNYYNASASINISGNTSSGYFSQSETEKSNLSSAKIVKSALGVVNRNMSVSNIERRSTEPERNLTSFHSVAEYCMRKKLHKKPSYEPSSPPKVKMGIVGSEKSKKSLRRLIR